MSSERGRLVGFLAASLLLNVFFGGVLVGRGFAVHRGPPRAPVPGPLVPQRHVVSLPEDQRAMFQAAMRAHREDLGAARRAHKAARDKIEADIAAPSFDRAAVAADFDALHKANRDLDAATSAALIDALAGLNAGARAALVVHDAASRPAPPAGPSKMP